MSDAPETSSTPDLHSQTNAASGELEQLRTQLADAETRAHAARDAQLRAVAELENVRKRAEREVSNGARYGAEKVLGELVLVCDSLDLGVKSAEQAAAADGSEAASKMLEGMKLTLQQLSQVMIKHGVVEIFPKGEAFDPNLHEAMTLVPSAELPPNHVLDVMQKGYRLHDRLLRPAMVIVTRAP